MKSLFNTLLLLAIAAPQAALATPCNIDDMDQRSTLSAMDDREITSSLENKGYSFDPDAAAEFTLVVDKGSSSPFVSVCNRKVAIYAPRVAGQLPAVPLLKFSATAPGLTGEWACVTALTKALAKVPACEEMRKLTKEHP